MKYFKGIPAVLLLAVAVSAQYNYPTPEPPRGTYLPPKTDAPATRPPPPPTQKPFVPQSETDISPEGLPAPANPDGEHEPGMPFDFTYAVKDDTGNDFSHNAQSDGDVVKGEYRVALPDGRIQIVRYTADWKNGYNAEVSYEGEAQYPEPTQKPFRPEQQELIDSQGITPARPVATRPPPPPPAPVTTQAPYRPPPQPVTTQAPYRPPVQTQAPYRPPVQTQPPRQTYAPQTAPPPTQPAPPPGLYGAPSLPFGVRNSPKFGYQN